MSQACGDKSSEKLHESFKNFPSSIHRCRFLFLISSVDSTKWPQAMRNACERKWGRGQSNIIKLCNFLREGGKSFSFFLKRNTRNYFRQEDFFSCICKWCYAHFVAIWNNANMPEASTILTRFLKTFRNSCICWLKIHINTYLTNKSQSEKNHHPSSNLWEIFVFTISYGKQFEWKNIMSA